MNVGVGEVRHHSANDLYHSLQQLQLRLYRYSWASAFSWINRFRLPIKQEYFRSLPDVNNGLMFYSRLPSLVNRKARKHFLGDLGALAVKICSLFSTSHNCTQPAPFDAFRLAFRRSHCDAWDVDSTPISIPADLNSPHFRRPRRSACAARSRAQELEHLRQMSIEARITAALSMGARFAWLKPAPKDS